MWSSAWSTVVDASTARLGPESQRAVRTSPPWLKISVGAAGAVALKSTFVALGGPGGPEAPVVPFVPFVPLVPFWPARWASLRAFFDRLSAVLASLSALETFLAS